MFNIMDRLIFNSLDKLYKFYSKKELGYQLAQLNQPDTRYKTLLKEVEGVYKKIILTDLPDDDEVRTDLLFKLLGTSVSEALYIVNYLHKSLHLAGDICEFGVAQGATSALMAHEIQKTDKTIWLFDSFAGLPKPSAKDTLKDDIFNLGSMDAYTGTMLTAVDLVQKRLNDINFPSERTQIIPGFIEETIQSSHLPQQVCFAYVDFDFYEPILVALNFLDQVLSPGGHILVDDYDFFSTGVKTAIDEFIAAHPDNYRLSLPIQSAGHFCMLEKHFGNA